MKAIGFGTVELTLYLHPDSNARCMIRLPMFSMCQSRSATPSAGIRRKSKCLPRVSAWALHPGGRYWIECLNYRLGTLSITLFADFPISGSVDHRRDARLARRRLTRRRSTTSACGGLRRSDSTGRPPLAHLAIRFSWGTENGGEVHWLFEAGLRPESARLCPLVRALGEPLRVRTTPGSEMLINPPISREIRPGKLVRGQQHLDVLQKRIVGSESTSDGGELEIPSLIAREKK
jgi:hypothetical protein